MKLIADANILFSLAREDSVATAITERYRIRLYSPDHALKELEKHRQELTEKTREPYLRILETLKKKTAFIEKRRYENHLKEAEKLLPDDQNDTPYIALAIKLQTAIWSNDKHLKTQDKIPVLTTRELLELLTP